MASEEDFQDCNEEQKNEGKLINDYFIHVLIVSTAGSNEDKQDQIKQKEATNMGLKPA